MPRPSWAPCLFLALALLFAACGDGPARDGPPSQPPEPADAGAASALDAGPSHPADTGLADTGPAGPADAGITSPRPERTWAWDPEAPDPPCEAGNDPLFFSALEAAGNTPERFGVTPDDLADSPVGPGLGDPFFLAPVGEFRRHPHTAGCFEGAYTQAIDAALASAQPSAHLIRAAARWLGAPEFLPPEPPPANLTLEAALARLCTTTGGDCSGDTGVGLPPDLAQAVAEIIGALVPVIEAQRAMAAGLPAGLKAADVARFGGTMRLPVPNAALDFLDEAFLPYMLGGEPRHRLYEAAARFAYAVENAGLRRFAGLAGIALHYATPLGAVIIADAADDTHDGPDHALMLIELGGDDTYLGAVGASEGAAYPFGVALDLAGNDIYTYKKTAGLPGLLPDDGSGRNPPANELEGPHSLSLTGRQGAGLNGVGLLWDFAGDDRYETLRMGQGYAHFGVGLLWDGGGRDTFIAEAGAQGAAQFGIGILANLGAEDDSYFVVSHGQGFGGVGAAGICADAGGDDTYEAEPGPVVGTKLIYPAIQMPADANISMAQGAAGGARYDGAGRYFSGGLGVLRDTAGDDRYRVGVFGQGASFWQGAAVLSDGGGSDTFDAVYYGQGSAAHYGVGVLSAYGKGGDDFNFGVGAAYAVLGAGHDFGVGAFVGGAAASRFRYPAFAAGAGNCSGVGLFVMNGGANSYDFVSANATGSANRNPECAGRMASRTQGIFVDGGGADTYTGRGAGPGGPRNEGTWAHAESGLGVELGGGADGEGGTNIVPGGVRELGVSANSRK